MRKEKYHHGDLRESLVQILKYFQIRGFGISLLFNQQGDLWIAGVPSLMMTLPLSQLNVGMEQGALVRSGMEILSEQGIDALTLRETARRAGVSHSAPYRHFRNKEGLLAAIAAEGFRIAHLRSNPGCGQRGRKFPGRAALKRARLCRFCPLSHGASEAHVFRPALRFGRGLCSRDGGSRCLLPDKGGVSTWP